MATPRGDVRFEADGMSYTLRFGTNALITLEQELGITINEIIERLQASPSMALMRLLFWAGLLKRHPDMTQAQAGDVLDDVTFERATSLITEALAAAFPDAKADPANPPKARATTA
jgi:hypothetical protein